MELLPSEFIQYANLTGLAKSKIEQLIGQKLATVEMQPNEDLSWRELPPYEEHKKNWQLLQNTATPLQCKRIARREVLQSYQLFCNANAITLLGLSNRNTIYFEPFGSYKAFENRFTKAFLDYPAMDFQNTPIQHLSSAEFDVLTLLIELFIEKYPYPYTEWQPEELLVFTAESLFLIMQDSATKDDDATWWQHWKKLAPKNTINKDDIAMGISLLASKELIGFTEEVEGQEVYFIGKKLTWHIRGMVWWDRGFLVSNPQNNTQFIVLEASALFVLTIENNNNYSLFNINGKDLPTYLQKYIHFSCQETSNKPIEEKSSSQHKNKSHFCTNCGSLLSADSRFCANCGQAIGK